jgi:type IV pilus assembly protein PilB
MPMTDHLRRVILERRPADELRAAARAEGMRTLREDGLEKIRCGITSVAEVLRVAGLA